MSNKYAFVIPCYQHTATLERIIKVIEIYKFPIVIVDDGSDESHKLVLQQLANEYALVHLETLSENQGKGVAVQEGLKAAQRLLCTHAIQVDSDGQHDLTAIPELLKCSNENPNVLVSGKPIYGGDVPKSRLYGRYVTHFWVWIETLGFHIEDSMCGFRIYPVQWTLDVCSKRSIGRRMDFDTDIMVGLYWYGVDSRFVPVKVQYPEDGISHFKLFADNFRITVMHTKLVIGMLMRFPKVILLNWGFFKKSNENTFWFDAREKGAASGVKLLFLVYKLLGRKIVEWSLWPVCFYYYLFFSKAKIASKEYLANVNSYFKTRKKFSSLKHIHCFAVMVLDRMSAWNGDIKKSQIRPEDHQAFMGLYKKGQGVFFLSSHYGNIEVTRCLGLDSYVKFNALVDYQNAKMINGFINRINPSAQLNLISTHKFGLTEAMNLQEKVSQGEWVFTMADRVTAASTERMLKVPFLGQTCLLPEGPFLMSYLFGVPIYTLHCYKEKKNFRIKIERLNILENAGRQQCLQSLAEQYAKVLEGLVEQDPYQWFNFFKFWEKKT